MRTILLAGLFLATGVTMTIATADVTGQEKKDKGPDPTKDESYTEKVQVRRYFNGGLSPNAIKDVPAFRHEKGSTLYIYTKAKGGATPTPKSELTDEKGAVWVVESVLESPGTGYHRSAVKAKPKE